MIEIVKSILEKYNIKVNNIVKLNDSSRSKEDIRLQYLVDDVYVVKMNTVNIVSESFLVSISDLIMRYREIGVWAPKLMQTLEGHFSVDMTKDGVLYHCYVEEYAPYKIAENVEDSEGLLRQMMPHLGKLATRFSGVELMDVPSMWTIIDLHPLDNEVDEKQDNLNELLALLKEKNYVEEAELLESTNKAARKKLKGLYKKLPRCVYQGDLNFLNILVDDNGEFKGIIDFNMAGTEVNINNFLNETMYQIEEKDFKEMSAEEIFVKMNSKQKKLLDIIFEEYHLNDDEKVCLPLYKKIIDISLYPNVMLWMHLLRENLYEEKLIKLIRLICERKADMP